MKKEDIDYSVYLVTDRRNKTDEEFLNIIEEGFAEAQINCDSLLFSKLRKPCLALIKEGYINYIATDTHSVLERPPHMVEAVDVLKSKLGKPETEKLLENSKVLISQGL